MKEYTTYIEEIEVKAYTTESEKLMRKIFRKLKDSNKHMWLEYNSEMDGYSIYTTTIEYKKEMVILAELVKREYERLCKLAQDLKMLGDEK